MKHQRNTKYTNAIKELLLKNGHMSNSQILEELVHEYPELSATTVHRITCRLKENGLICLAPSMRDGSMRYDSNILPHDHFICNNCNRLRDIDISDSLIPIISKALGGCKITGKLVINGNCEKCINSNGAIK